MEVRFKGDVLVFGEWTSVERYDDDVIQWCRPLLGSKFSAEGIVLRFIMEEDTSWHIKWRTHTLLFRMYYQMHSIPPVYKLDQIEQAKQHVDKFLERVNNLVAFL